MIWYFDWKEVQPKAVALAKALRDDGEGVLAAPGPMANIGKTIVIEIGPNPHQPASSYHGPD